MVRKRWVDKLAPLPRETTKEEIAEALHSELDELISKGRAHGKRYRRLCGILKIECEGGNYGLVSESSRA
jgi:hypothetical protein